MSTSSTLMSVSTLLIAVGFWKTPFSTGNGGFERGSPRKPSIELKIAVSSPQMYAPAPRRISRSKVKPSPKMSSPSRPRSYAWSIAFWTARSASGYSPRR